MVIHTYEIGLEHKEVEAIRTILNQRTVVDDEEMEKLINYIERKITNAYNVGVSEGENRNSF